MLRLLDSAEPNPPAYNLLCRYLVAARRPGAGSAAPRLETALAFRLKLALAAGFAPELASCARCGEAEHLTGFSGAAGGVVCAACEAGSFPLSEEAHRFMVEALGQAARRGAARRRSAACARSSARSARRSSTTRTCSCAPPPERGSRAGAAPASSV